MRKGRLPFFLLFVVVAMGFPGSVRGDSFRFVPPEPPVDGFGESSPVEVRKENKLLPTDVWWIVAREFTDRPSAEAFVARFNDRCGSNDLWIHLMPGEVYEKLPSDRWYAALGARRTEKEAGVRKEALRKRLEEVEKSCRVPLTLTRSGPLKRVAAWHGALKQWRVDPPSDFVCWSRDTVAPDLRTIAYTQRYEWPEEGGEAWGAWNVNENLFLLDLKNRERTLVYDEMTDAGSLRFSSDGRYLLLAPERATNSDFAAHTVRVFDTKAKTLYVYDCPKILKRPGSGHEGHTSCSAPEWEGPNRIRYRVDDFYWTEDDQMRSGQAMQTTVFNPRSPKWKKGFRGFTAAYDVYPSFLSRQQAHQCSEAEKR